MMRGYMGELCWYDQCDDCADPDCYHSCHDPDGEEYAEEA